MSKVKARKASHAEASTSHALKHDYITRITFTQALMQRVCMLEDDAKELYKLLMQTKSGEAAHQIYPFLLSNVDSVQHYPPFGSCD